uniref:MULE transposase domain-containing protein n=1 Tax=Ditylenchus dipsaci TaxID=166011 RepID=A0A915CR58_9BILA
MSLTVNCRVPLKYVSGYVIDMSEICLKYVSTICLVYVVLADRGDGFHFPIADALLPNKKRATYDKMWAMIKQQYPNLKPQSFSCDFEINPYKSIPATFGLLIADFRSFHLSQNHIKRLKILKLFKLYKRNVDIYHQSRLLLALAYVPVAQVHGFADIVLTMITLPELQPLMQWFDSIYVGDHNHQPQGTATVECLRAGPPRSTAL